MGKLAALIKAGLEEKLVKEKLSDYATVSLTDTSPDLIAGWFLQTFRKQKSFFFQARFPDFFFRQIKSNGVPSKPK